MKNDHLEHYIESMVQKKLNQYLRQTSLNAMSAEQKEFSENKKSFWSKMKDSLSSVVYTKPTIAQLWAETGDTTAPSLPQQSIGWSTSTPPNSYFFNYKQQITDQFLLYINQQGLCQWDNATDYPIGAYVKGSDSNLYLGLSTPNVGNNPTTDLGANWLKILDIGSALALGVGSFLFLAYDSGLPVLNYLDCLGQVLNIVDYPVLGTLLGNTWGGDGSTTFGMPPAGYVLAGQGGVGDATLGNVTGNVGGERANTLGIPNIPGHHHNSSDGKTFQTSDTGAPSGSNHYSTTTGSSSLGVPQVYNNTSPSTTNTGGGLAHNNIQPTAICRVLLKYQ